MKRATDRVAPHRYLANFNARMHFAENVTGLYAWVLYMAASGLRDARPSTCVNSRNLRVSPDVRKIGVAKK